jgi:hypothetical protein
MCPQAPRLSPEYSHKAGLQTVIIGRPLQIGPVMRSGHAGPVTVGRITRGPPCWTRPQDKTTSSQVFVRRRVGRRVNLPVVLSPLVQRGRRRHRAKGGVFAFTPTDDFLYCLPDNKELSVCREMARSLGFPKLEVGLCAMTKDDLEDSLAYNSLKVQKL